MNKRIGLAAAVCSVLLVGCGSTVQTSTSSSTGTIAGEPAPGAETSGQSITAPEENGGTNTDTTTDDGETPAATEGITGEVPPAPESVTTDDAGTPPITDGVTDEGTPPTIDPVTTNGGEGIGPQGPQSNLDIYWVQPLECAIVARGGTGGADGLTIFVGLRSGGETVDSLVPVRASTDSGGSSSANAAAGSDGSTAVQVNLAAGDYGRTLAVTVTADPDNTISESNKSNNTLNIAIDMPPYPTSQDVQCRAS